jgi:peroxiredoxin
MKTRFFQLLMLPFLFIIACDVKTHNEFKINGTVPVALNGKVIILQTVYPYPTPQERPKDMECLIQDGQFSFSVRANGLEKYVLKINENSASSWFALLPQNTTITFSDERLKTYQVYGNDINRQDSLLQLALGQTAGSHEFIHTWIEKHLESSLSPFYIYGIKEHISDDELSRLYRLVPSSIKTDSWGKELTFIIDSLQIGKSAPDFKQLDDKGKIVSLSNYKGKVVLVDFWASWCVPCRAESPKLVRSYNKYHKLGFEIIGVSVDDQANLWKEAIAHDSLAWIHVSDLNGWDNVVSKKYRIHSIPSNFLLDREGKIVAKNISGDELLSMRTDALFAEKERR